MNYINNDDVFGIASKGLNAFEEVGFVDDEAVVAIEPMGYPLLGVDEVDDPISVQFLTGSEDDDLV
jgi:hypothetical protein